MIKNVPGERYDWKRFWCPRDGSINLHDGGYLVDPDSQYGRHWNADLRPFDSISNLPCLALLGEPGIGKTTTMQAEREKIDARVRAEGGDTPWLNLNAYGSEVTLREKLFGNEKFVSWRAGDHRLHVFLDGLDECRLRIDNVAALLVSTEVRRIVADVVGAVDVGFTIAEFIPRQVMHLRQILNGFPLISKATAD